MSESEFAFEKNLELNVSVGIGDGEEANIFVIFNTVLRVVIALLIDLYKTSTGEISTGDSFCLLSTLH